MMVCSLRDENALIHHHDRYVGLIPRKIFVAKKMSRRFNFGFTVCPICGRAAHELVRLRTSPHLLIQLPLS